VAPCAQPSAQRPQGGTQRQPHDDLVAQLEGEGFGPVARLTFHLGRRAPAKKFRRNSNPHVLIEKYKLARILLGFTTFLSFWWCAMYVYIYHYMRVLIYYHAFYQYTHSDVFYVRSFYLFI
jgi:hypothetical protein